MRNNKIHHNKTLNKILNNKIYTNVCWWIYFNWWWVVVRGGKFSLTGFNLASKIPEAKYPSNSILQKSNKLVFYKSHTKRVRSKSLEVI